MLTLTEKEQLVSAVREWSENAPDVEMFGSLLQIQHLTPKQLVAAIEADGADARNFLEIMEHSIRRQGIDAVVTKFKEAAER